MVVVSDHYASSIAAVDPEEDQFEGKEEKMIETMKELLRRNSMCVLATCSENQPHCSLMSYVADDEAETLFMATLKTSRKYRNIVQCPAVSVLVDTRVADTGERGAIRALTISGTAFIIQQEAERDRILSCIEEAHPHLGELLNHQDAEIVAVRAVSFLLLDGPIDAYFVQV